MRGSSDVEVINIKDTVDGIREDDVIIAFMGPTGSGKSFFIDLLTNQKGKRASGALKPLMKEVQSTYVKHVKHPGRRIILVDTPGFDDATMTDMEVLEIISKWLTNTYEQYVKLSGIIYLHRITDNRVGGSQRRNLRLFGELVGNDAMKNVILVSTMWNRIIKEVGEKREKELQTRFWETMIREGSRTDRLAQATFEDAWRVVDRLIQDHDAREKMLLQHEVVELKRVLSEAHVGRNLDAPLQMLLGEQKEMMEQIIEQMKQQGGNEEAKKILEREVQRIQRQFEKVLHEVARLKLSIGRRITLFFLGTRTRRVTGDDH